MNVVNIHKNKLNSQVNYLISNIKRKSVVNSKPLIKNKSFSLPYHNNYFVLELDIIVIRLVSPIKFIPIHVKNSFFGQPVLLLTNAIPDFFAIAGLPILIKFQ